MNLRKKAESLVASAEEKASLSDGKLIQLSESIEREKSRLQRDVGQLKKDSKFAVSRISADVSI